MSDIAGMQERIEDLQADGAKAAMWRTDAIAELLAELRKRGEALARVEALAKSAIPMQGLGGMYSGIVMSDHILAALREQTA